MRFFNRGAPSTILPSGYQPDLDRLPPGGGMGCRRLLMLIGGGFAAIAFIGFVVVSVVNGARQPSIEVLPSPTATETPDATSTPTPSPTLDDWSATGTALVEATASSTFTPTATADYCAWLTPTATYTPTLIHTPDNWSATGTAVYLATNPPPATPQPQPTTPRSWCDDVPTATITPLALPRRTLSTPTPEPTSTVTPRPMNGGGNSAGIHLPPTNVPPVAPPTDLPPIVLPPTLLPFPTAVNTKKPTRTPTETATNTPTATATASATYTPSATWTATSTPTETATNTPTPTNTAVPFITVFSTSCAAGYPEFAVQNLGAVPGEIVLYDIRLGDLVAASGYWTIELATNAPVIAAAPMWAGVPGIYVLTIYQPWDMYIPAQSAAVSCAGIIPTMTHTATATIGPESTAEFTITPTATATIEVIE